MTIETFSWRIKPFLEIRDQNSRDRVLGRMTAAFRAQPGFARFARGLSKHLREHQKFLLQPIKILESDDEVTIGLTRPRHHVFGDAAVRFSKAPDRFTQHLSRGNKKRADFGDNRLN